MGLEPVDWGVIIPGRWNQSILTPAGLCKYVFALSPPKQMKVLVPLDGLSAYQVKHPDAEIIALTEHERLLITLIQMDYPTLGKAMQAGVTALTLLPETPVLAAGFNIKFRSSDPSDEVGEAVKSNIDTLLSDTGFTIEDRLIGRSLAFGDGQLNLAITSSPAGFEVRFNFHRESSEHKDLIAWLGTPVAHVQAEVEKILGCLKLDIQEFAHAANTE